MKTLTLSNGDLVVGQGGFTTVTGTAKVKQDLGVAVREPYGCDRFHPRWGTTLINYIGGIVGPEIDTLVKSEITRLIKNYIAVQGEQMSNDATAGAISRFSTADMIQRIDGIDVAQEFDRFHVQVRLTLTSGDQVTLTRSVTG